MEVFILSLETGKLVKAPPKMSVDMSKLLLKELMDTLGAENVKIVE